MHACCLKITFDRIITRTCRKWLMSLALSSCQECESPHSRVPAVSHILCATQSRLSETRLCIQSHSLRLWWSLCGTTRQIGSVSLSLYPSEFKFIFMWIGKEISWAISLNWITSVFVGHVSLSLLTFKCLCDEPLEVVHVFRVFGLGGAEDVPVWSSSNDEINQNSETSMLQRSTRGRQMG